MEHILWARDWEGHKEWGTMRIECDHWIAASMCLFVYVEMRVQKQCGAEFVLPTDAK